MRNYAGERSSGCVIGSLRRREGGGFFLRSGADRVRTIRHERWKSVHAEQGNNVGSRACWQARVTIHCDPLFPLTDSASESSRMSIVLSIPVQGRDIRVPVRVQPLIIHDYPRRRSSKRPRDKTSFSTFSHHRSRDIRCFRYCGPLRRRYRERLSPPFCNLL